MEREKEREKEKDPSLKRNGDSSLARVQFSQSVKWSESLSVNSYFLPIQIYQTYSTRIDNENENLCRK